MDTKEKRPARRSADRRPAPSQRRAAPQRRRRVPSDPREQRKAQGSARTTHVQKTRVVRPPREDIPEVVYTMPKPFHKGRFLLKLLSVVAVVMALVMALSIFFKVDTVRVYGMDKYTPWMICEASGIQNGDSLLGISKAKVAGRIIAKLPYVDDVKIGINLPGTVNIEITELKVTYAVQASDSTWWLITSDGRVVEQIDTTAASGYTRILGVKAEAPRVGQQVYADQTQQVTEATTDGTEETTAPEETAGTEETASTAETAATEETAGTEDTESTEETKGSDENQPNQNQAGDNQPAAPTQNRFTQDQKMQIALEIISCLEKNGVFGRIASIDVSDGANLTMEYGQRFHVLLGDAERLEYKITYMAQAVKQLQPNDAGELDVSFAFSDEALLTPAG